jgi:hypothetical protein
VFEWSDFAIADGLEYLLSLKVCTDGLYTLTEIRQESFAMSSFERRLRSQELL